MRTTRTVWCLGTAVAVAALAFAGCAPETRHEVLSFFFDGVPPLHREHAVSAGTESGPEGGRQRYGEHGPYAAKLCDACHLQGSNNLVLPKDELCFKCHVLNLDRKMLHGPLASGSCVICHGPHGSSNRFLLVADAKEFCVYCHDRNELLKREVHQGAEAECIVCHDAHGSDSPYLLK